MIEIQAVESILNDSTKLVNGMKKYKYIMDTLHWTDVSTDKDFLRTFNDFFVMRSRKSNYYSMFYSFLEEKKTRGVSSEETLEHLSEIQYIVLDQITLFL